MPAAVVCDSIILVIVLAVGISGQVSNNSIAYSVQSGHYRMAPDATLPLKVLTNSPARTRTLADYRGRVVLVNLFASWCTQCQLEAPELARVDTMLKRHGGTVLGITYQNRPGAALGFVRQYHVSYPVLQDASGRLASAYGITSGVPDSYLIDRQGRIVALNLYEITPAWVKQTLPRWLRA